MWENHEDVRCERSEAVLTGEKIKLAEESRILLGKTSSARSKPQTRSAFQLAGFNNLGRRKDDEQISYSGFSV